MDNIAHALTGAALGQAGLKRLTGLALPALMVSANVPDIDALTMLTGGSLYWRRGWTHGPPALVILPALVAALTVAFDRWQARRETRPSDRPPVRFGPMLLLCYIGTISHVLLDLLNTYGIRLLMPFSERWFYGDVLFVVDPWVWMGLGLGVWLARRRENSGSRNFTFPAIGALLAATLYVGAMYAGGRLAERYAAGQIAAAGAGSPESILASPVPFNSLRREILIKTPEGYRFGDYSWIRSPRLNLEPDIVPTNMSDPAIANAADQDVRFANFLYWSRYPFASISRSDCATQVTINDGRYTRSPDSGTFRRTVLLDHCD